MQIIRRIFFWIIVNIAVIALFSIISSFLGLGGYLTQNGIDYTSLLFFAAFFGFAGSFVSLLISKWMAKRTFGIRLIETPTNHQEAHLVQVVSAISSQLGISVPEIGIYPSAEVNAFATGASKNNSLVAVSQGLLNRMDKNAIEGVLAHEMAHIANGDMVTMTLLQGVINTFVIFGARVLASVITPRSEDGGATGMYFLVSIVLEIAFGFLASLIIMAFSRWREYRADAGGARFVGRQKMVHALQTLAQNYGAVDTRQKNYASLKMNGVPRTGLAELLMTHPPLEKRIAALQQG